LRTEESGGEFRQAQPRIFVSDELYAQAFGFAARFGNAEHGDSAATHRVVDERRAVGVAARQCGEEIAWPDFAAVARESCEIFGGCHFCVAHITRSYIRPRLWFHYVFSLASARIGAEVGMLSMGAMRAMTRPASGAAV